MDSQQSSLPSWLATSQNYRPPSDQDGFIDRSIKAFLGLLRVLRRRTPAAHRMASHTRIALPVLLWLIVLVSLSRNLGFLALTGVCALVVLSLLPARSIAAVLANALGAAGFSLLILLPSLWLGNAFGMLLIGCKVLISVGLLKMLTETSDWAALSAALAGLRIPGLFILVLDLTLRYLTRLGEFSLTMLYALRLRSVGRNRDKSAALSGIAGTLYLKSRHMGQESHAAMECRGFTGDYHPPASGAFALADAALLLASLALGLAFFLLR